MVFVVKRLNKQTNWGKRPVAIKSSGNPNPSKKNRFTKENRPKVISPGRPRLFLKELSSAAYATLIEDLMKLDKGQLRRTYKDKRTNGVTALLARAMYWGDTAELERLLSRVLGAVPQRTELTGASGQPLIPAVINIQPIKSLTKS